MPLRDTSALAISFNFNHTNNDRGEAIIVRLIRATQFTTPFILTALHLVSNWWGVFEGVSRVSNILAVDILGKLIIYIALPLGVFLLRYRRGRASGLAHAASVAAEEKRSPSDALSHETGIFPPPPVSIPPSPPSPGAAGWRNVLVQRPAWSQEQMPLTQFKVVATKFNGKTLVPPQGAAAGGRAALAGGTSAPDAPSIRSCPERGGIGYRSRVAPSPSDLSLLQPLDDGSLLGELSWMALEAATRLQCKFRQRKARRRMRAELADRKRRLLFFSWPIFVASMFDLVANTVVEHLIYWGQLGEMWYLYSILFIVPSMVICVRDLRLENRPRFSIAHGMFLIIVLYRVALKAALIDIYVEYYLTIAFTEIEAGVGQLAELTSEGLHMADTSNSHFNMSSDHFNSSSSSSGLYPVPKGEGTLVQTFVPLLTMIVHLSIFIMVTSFGKLSLELVATSNACAHLLFPFQFFDFVFLYSFFTLRSMGTPLTSSWVLQQIVLQVPRPLLSLPPTSLTSLSSPQLILGPPFLLLQINIVLRNSGTTEVLVARCGLGNRIFNFLLGKKTKDKLKNFDPNKDPLIRLQYLARIGWQFDLADVCALLIVPTVVSVMIWRQGFYSLEGSTILVRRAGPSRIRPRPSCAPHILPAILILALLLSCSLFAQVRPCELRNVWARFAVLLCIKPAASWIARAWLRAKMRSTLLGKKTMHGTSQIAAKMIAMRKMRVQGMQGGNMDEKVQAHFDFKEEEMAAMQKELSLSGLNYSVLRAKLMKKWRFFLAVVLFQIFSAFPCRSTAPGRIIEQCELNGTKVVAILSEPLTVQSSWYYVPPEIAISSSPILIGTYAASVEEVANTADCNITSSFFTTFRNSYAGWETLEFPDLDQILAADYVLSSSGASSGGYVDRDDVLESYVPEEREKIKLVRRTGNCTREARGGDF